MHPDDERGLLRDRFGEQRTALPPHLDWEAVEAGIPSTPPSAKRYPWLWWLGGAAGAVLLAFGIAVLTTNAADVPTDLPTAPAQPTRTEVPPTDRTRLLPQDGADPTQPTQLRTPRDRRGTDRPRLAPASESAPYAPPSRPTEITKQTRLLPRGAADPDVGSSHLQLAAQQLPVPAYRVERERFLPAVTSGFRPYGRKSGLSYTLTTGASLASRPLSGVRSLPGPALHFAVERPVGRGGNQRLGLLLTYDRLDFRSDLTTSGIRNVYRPGTPDTLFVDPFTGAERLVTTDSVLVNYTETRRRHSQLRQLGGLLRYVRQFGRGRLRAEASTALGIDYRFATDGTLLLDDGALTPGTAAPNLAVTGLIGGSLYYALQPGVALVVSADQQLVFRNGDRDRLRLTAGIRVTPSGTILPRKR